MPARVTRNRLEVLTARDPARIDCDDHVAAMEQPTRIASQPETDDILICDHDVARCVEDLAQCLGHRADGELESPVWHQLTPDDDAIERGAAECEGDLRPWRDRGRQAKEVTDHHGKILI